MMIMTNDVFLQLKENLQLINITIYTNDGQVKTIKQIVDEINQVSNKIPIKLLSNIMANLNGQLVIKEEPISAGIFDF